jgi:hypothetical protein
MAHQTLFRVPGLGPTAEQRRRDDQQRRRNLRIAIRQLERAELYLVALYSLGLEDHDAEASVDDLLGRLRALERHLLQIKLTA